MSKLGTWAWPASGTSIPAATAPALHSGSERERLRPCRGRGQKNPRRGFSVSSRRGGAPAPLKKRCDVRMRLHAFAIGTLAALLVGKLDVRAPCMGGRSHALDHRRGNRHRFRMGQSTRPDFSRYEGRQRQDREMDRRRAQPVADGRHRLGARYGQGRRRHHGNRPSRHRRPESSSDPEGCIPRRAGTDRVRRLATLSVGPPSGGPIRAKAGFHRLYDLLWRIHANDRRVRHAGCTGVHDRPEVFRPCCEAREGQVDRACRADRGRRWSGDRHVAGVGRSEQPARRA